MPDLVRSACLTSFPDVARSVGLQPLQMLDAAGIDRGCLTDPEIRLPVDAIRRLLELCARTAGIDDFGLRLAETRTLSVLGPLGLLVREEPTVRRALQSLARHLRLHNQGLALRVEEYDGEAIVSVGFRLARPLPMRQSVELTIGVLCRVMTILIGRPWRPRVCFTHGPPRRLDRHRRMFGSRVEFNCDFNGIVCAADDLDQAVSGADPVFARYVRQYLDSLLGEEDSTIEQKVRELVRLQFASGRCTAKRIAQQLGFDRRTLHRRLAVNGANFHAIVESVRAEIAVRMMQNQTRSFTTIADELGFSSSGAYSRWFKKHFGANPSSWRRESSALS